MEESTINAAVPLRREIPCRGKSGDKSPDIRIGECILVLQVKDQPKPPLSYSSVLAVNKRNISPISSCGTRRIAKTRV